jgi:hypothetical protein
LILLIFSSSSFLSMLVLPCGSLMIFINLFLWNSLKISSAFFWFYLTSLAIMSLSNAIDFFESLGSCINQSNIYLIWIDSHFTYFFSNDHM